MEVGAKGLQERQAQKAAQEAARLAAAREQSKPVDPKEALADALVEEVRLFPVHSILSLQPVAAPSLQIKYVRVGDGFLLDN